MNWKICADKAAEHGHEAQRSAWRLVGPMHIAETREKARENVRFGLAHWLRYFQEVAALPLAPAGSIDNAIDALVGSGLAVIGDPDDAFAQLERLEKQSGGFGCFLQMAHNWADFAETRRSYELFARYVTPRFQQLNVNRDASMNWAAANRPTFIGAMGNAINQEIQKHVAEQKEKQEHEGS
jgi:limonene 1,2-monooxygenase